VDTVVTTQGESFFLGKILSVHSAGIQSYLGKPKMLLGGLTNAYLNLRREEIPILEHILEEEESSHCELSNLCLI
jgi:hypothetical protein